MSKECFEVVLPDGILTYADACTNPDLFWALRGGGGGTFGVLTHVEYKALPKAKITIISFEMDSKTWQHFAAIRVFLEYWIRYTPTADRRVGGAYFSAWRFEMCVLGDEKVAEMVFLTQFRACYDSTFKAAGFKGSVDVTEFDSFFDYINDGGKSFENSNVNKGHGPNASSRIVPEDKLVNDPEELLDFLIDLHQYEWWGPIGSEVQSMMSLLVLPLFIQRYAALHDGPFRHGVLVLPPMLFATTYPMASLEALSTTKEQKKRIGGLLSGERITTNDCWAYKKV